MEIVSNKIKEFISGFSGVNMCDIKDTAHIINDLELDSLDHIELIMAIEDEFDIEISDGIADGVHTVERIVTMTVSVLDQQRPHWKEQV